MIKMNCSLIFVFLLSLAIVRIEGWGLFRPWQNNCREDQCSVFGECWPLSQENQFCDDECPCAPGLECVDRPRPDWRPRPRPGPGPGGFRRPFRRGPFGRPPGEDPRGPFGGPPQPLENGGPSVEHGPFRRPGRDHPRPGRGAWRRPRRFGMCVNSTNPTTTSPNVTAVPTTLPETVQPTTQPDFISTVQPTNQPGFITTVQPTNQPDLITTVQTTTNNIIDITTSGATTVPPTTTPSVATTVVTTDNPTTP